MRQIEQPLWGKISTRKVEQRLLAEKKISSVVKNDKHKQ
jgi:hypothetical protein